VGRYRKSGCSRGKRAALGGAIGFGAGFAIEAGVAGNCSHFCIISPGEVGAVVGGLGLLSGAIVGGLLPRHDKDLLYVVK
jgi:hypothetical protein